MPFVKLKFKNGQIEADYEGFPNNTCDYAQVDIIQRLRVRKMELTGIDEQRKDELLQEEDQVETA